MPWGRAEHIPVFEIDGGAVVKLEGGVAEDGFPVADAVLETDQDSSGGSHGGTHAIAAVDEHLGLLLGPFLARFFLGGGRRGEGAGPGGCVVVVGGGPGAGLGGHGEWVYARCMCVVLFYSKIYTEDVPTLISPPPRPLSGPRRQRACRPSPRGAPRARRSARGTARAAGPSSRAPGPRPRPASPESASDCPRVSADTTPSASHPPERLHHQVFHLVHRQPRLLPNRLETHRPVVRRPPEHALDQRHQAYLLPQKRIVLLQNRLQAASATTHAHSTTCSRTSCGNSGARASNFPMLPSLNVNKSFFIHSRAVPVNASKIGCINLR